MCATSPLSSLQRTCLQSYQSDHDTGALHDVDEIDHACPYGDHAATTWTKSTTHGRNRRCVYAQRPQNRACVSARWSCGPNRPRVSTRRSRGRKQPCGLVSELDRPSSPVGSLNRLTHVRPAIAWPKSTVRVRPARPWRPSRPRRPRASRLSGGGSQLALDERRLAVRDALWRRDGAADGTGQEERRRRRRLAGGRRHGGPRRRAAAAAAAHLRLRHVVVARVEVLLLLQRKILWTGLVGKKHSLHYTVASGLPVYFFYSLLIYLSYIFYKISNLKVVLKSLSQE